MKSKDENDRLQAGTLPSDGFEGLKALDSLETSEPLARKAKRMSFFAAEARKPVRKILTDLPFDELLDPLVPGLGAGRALWIAANTGQGKSRILIAIAKNLAKRGIAVLLFTAELGGVEVSRIAGTEADTLPIDIIEEEVTLLEIQTEIAAFSEAHPEGVVLLDYVQLYAFADDRNGKSYAVANIAKALRQFAKVYKVPLIGAVQLNRNAQVEGVDPGLNHLADSSGLERNADHVIILTLEGSIITARVKKNRWGPNNGEAKLNADFEKLTFALASGEEVRNERTDRLMSAVERFVLSAKRRLTFSEISSGIKFDGGHPKNYEVQSIVASSQVLSFDARTKTVGVKVTGATAEPNATVPPKPLPKKPELSPAEEKEKLRTQIKKKLLKKELEAQILAEEQARAGLNGKQAPLPSEAKS